MSDDKLRRKIELALKRQLKERQLNKHAHYSDLVQDYLALWDIKNQLFQDIEKRGVSIYWCNGGGQEGYKKNDSISELVKVNKQMLKILLDLGIRASDLEVAEEDEEL